MSKPTHTLAIEYVPIGDLRPNPKNARRHSPAQLRQVARSIESFGFNAPILVDRFNTVIAGHGRLGALKLLKRADAPVNPIDGSRLMSADGALKASQGLTTLDEVLGAIGE